MSQDAALQAYFAEAASWDADRAAMRERSMRVAWRIAALAVLLAFAAIVALVCLLPLKRVEPFVIRVDNTTGIVDVVPVFVWKSELPETVTRYFLDHYVTVCERFNYSTAESDYEECAAFHAPARNQQWFAQWDRSKPDSPLNAFKDGTTIRAQVSSISFFDRASGAKDLAQIRYTKARRAPGAIQEQTTHWIATVRYAYAEPSKTLKSRRWNPLGFKIVEFRPESEVTPVPASTTGAAP